MRDTKRVLKGLSKFSEGSGCLCRTLWKQLGMPPAMETAETALGRGGLWAAAPTDSGPL